MAASTITLSEFLLARIAEDEAAARAAHPSSGDDTWTAWVCDEHMHVAMGEDRMLAECKMRRDIIKFAEHGERLPIGPTADAHTGATIAIGLVLRAFASAYANHPDYNAEGWKS